MKSFCIIISIVFLVIGCQQPTIFPAIAISSEAQQATVEQKLPPQLKDLAEHWLEERHFIATVTCEDPCVCEPMTFDIRYFNDLSMYAKRAKE